MTTNSRRLTLFTSLGPQLLSYRVDISGALLIKQDVSATLPANVQYACPHSSGHYLYVVSSYGGPGRAGSVHHASAFRIDSQSGALHAHGEPVPLPSRPIHITTDVRSEHALIAYTNLDTVTVLQIAPDGTFAGEVRQSASLDTGVFVHQVCVTPSNQAAILVARGNDARSGKPEDPGALKLFRYCRGVLTNWMSVAPAGGYGFGPRNIALDPVQPWAYVSLERQNKLHVFRFEGDKLGEEPLFESETLTEPGNVRPGQMTGAVHVHPKGRFVYAANRAFGTADLNDKTIFVGGENSIAVYAIDYRTGKPSMIQTIDSHGIYPRTFTIDPSGSLLVVANVRPLLIQEGATLRMVPANIAMFAIADNGTLTFARRYEVNSSLGEPFWSGMVTAPAPLFV